MNVLNMLIEEGALVRPDAGRGPASGWADPVEHARMLHDDRRTGDYLAALAAAVRPGDVVLDIGTGSGVLAVAAARAGARRVYAVEASDIAEVAGAGLRRQRRDRHGHARSRLVARRSSCPSRPTCWWRRSSATSRSRRRSSRRRSTPAAAC